MKRIQSGESVEGTLGTKVKAIENDDDTNKLNNTPKKSLRRSSYRTTTNEQRRLFIEKVDILGMSIRAVRTHL